jgi:hypothetical protein
MAGSELTTGQQEASCRDQINTQMQRVKKGENALLFKEVNFCRRATYMGMSLTLAHTLRTRTGTNRYVKRSDVQAPDFDLYLGKTLSNRSTRNFGNFGD